MDENNFRPSSPKKIGYEFSEKENFWTINIPIKSNNVIDFTNFENFLKNPNITCQCLCIGIKQEGTTEEFIYTMGLYKCEVNPNTIGVNNITGKEIANNPDDYDKYVHLANCVSLCCRAESSEYDPNGQRNSNRPTAKIIKHYIFDPEWIHEKINDEIYWFGYKEIKSGILDGRKLFDEGFEYSDSD